MVARHKVSATSAYWAFDKKGAEWYQLTLAVHRKMEAAIGERLDLRLPR